MFNNEYCPLEIWAPGNRSHVENTAFTLFAIDCERKSEFERIIETAVDAYDPSRYLQEEVLESKRFTSKEKEYILKEVEYRLQ